MKNLFTLFLVSITALGFSQVSSINGTVKLYHVQPNSASRPDLHRSGVGSARSSMGCDTVDALDYSTYNELNAANLQINFNGSWNSQSPSIAAAELTSTFINSNSADNADVSYAVCAFDTLAFADYTGPNQYSMNLAGSTISFDSMGIFIGIFGDTLSADGIMANDSLVFRIYPINGGVVSTTAVKSINFTGYAGLAPFFVQPNYLQYASIQVGQVFNQGQGFAVRAEYYRADTSSHCLLSYTYADSCGTVTIQNTSYSSPAYPSPFIKTAHYNSIAGSNFYGEIDSGSVGGNVDSATVSEVSNSDYFNLASYGVSKSCSYYYIQNWEMIPYVTITSSLGIGFSGDTVTLPCNGSATHTVTPIVTGDAAGAQYSWSSSQNTESISTTTPGVYSVTVTNPLNCTASASVTVMYPGGADVNPSFIVPDSVCIGSPTGFINNSSDVTGYTSNWNLGQGHDSISTATNPVYNYTATGIFPVTLTMDSGGCSFSTTQNVNVTQMCATGIQNIAFENNISILPNPSNGNITITVNGADDNINITVFNIIGQAVKVYTSSSVASVFNHNFDLSNLSDGTYLVKIQSGSKIATKKLIIAN